MQQPPGDARARSGMSRVCPTHFLVGLNYVCCVVDTLLPLQLQRGLRFLTDKQHSLLKRSHMEQQLHE